MTLCTADAAKNSRERAVANWPEWAQIVANPLNVRRTDERVVMASDRFLTLADVAEVLNTSSAQVYALVRRKELKAIKIGGRGQWRVEDSELEAFIQRMYDQTDTFIDEHPFEDADLPEPVDQDD